MIDMSPYYPVLPPQTIGRVRKDQMVVVQADRGRVSPGGYDLQQ